MTEEATKVRKTKYDTRQLTSECISFDPSRRFIQMTSKSQFEFRRGNMFNLGFGSKNERNESQRTNDSSFQMNSNHGFKFICLE